MTTTQSINIEDMFTDGLQESIDRWVLDNQDMLNDAFGVAQSITPWPEGYTFDPEVDLDDFAWLVDPLSQGLFFNLEDVGDPIEEISETVLPYDIVADNHITFLGMNIQVDLSAL